LEARFKCFSIPLHHRITQTQSDTSLSQHIFFLQIVPFTPPKAKQTLNMVALPTLRSQHDMPASPKYSAADTFLAAIDSEVDVADNTQTVSMLHPHGVVLSLGPLFRNDDYDQTYLSPSQGHDHMSAPTDGSSVWYCSNCRDGPLGDWQNVCTSCSHVKCGFCTVEHTK
jgi:hypothetical protein